MPYIVKKSEVDFKAVMQKKTDQWMKFCAEKDIEKLKEFYTPDVRIYTPIYGTGEGKLKLSGRDAVTGEIHQLLDDSCRDVVCHVTEAQQTSRDTGFNIYEMLVYKEQRVVEKSAGFISWKKDLEGNGKWQIHRQHCRPASKAPPPDTKKKYGSKIKY